jgi:hypothetical protein
MLTIGIMAGPPVKMASPPAAHRGLRMSERDRVDQDGTTPFPCNRPRDRLPDQREGPKMRHAGLGGTIVWPLAEALERIQRVFEEVCAALRLALIAPRS